MGVRALGRRSGRLAPKHALLALTLALVPRTLPGADQAQLDSSEALFTVLAAANAAGYDYGLGSSSPLRARVRAEVEATKAPILSDLRAWYREHPSGGRTQDLSRFVSLGLSIGGPPDFSWSKREVEVPPDAMEMDGFRKLLPEFYQQARMAEVWKNAQASITPDLERYQGPVADTLLQVNAYLRNQTYGYLGRHFSVFLEYLAPSNQVQNRSYGDDFFVVITPSKELRIAEVRHAYLRYLIDPLAIKYGMLFQPKSSLMDIAEGAPLLPEPYRTKFDLLATECLIKAIESRMTRNPGMISQAVRTGFILTPFFDEQLALYEKQPQAMKLFFPQMIEALNVRHEIQRLDKVQFATEAPKGEERGAPDQVRASSGESVTLAGATLAKADQSYEAKDLQEAERLYKKALTEPGTAPEHARAYFGLAHIALMRNEAERADELFRKTLTSSPEPDPKAWSCYYLGKLYALAKEPEEARKWFQEAIETQGAPAKAVESSRREMAHLSNASTEKSDVDVP